MMKEIINAFYARSHEGGLYLIAVPTGQGKTYAVVNYIAKNFSKWRKGKIFYLTTQKKNVEEAFNDCKEITNKKELFEKRAIHLKSNLDYVSEWFRKKHEARLPENIRQSRQFRDLANSYSTYQGNPNEKSWKQFDVDEREFRKHLGDILKKEFGSKGKPEETLRKLEEKTEYAELFELYPQLRLDEKSIIFSTVDKFMVPNSSIIGPSHRFWNDEDIDKSLIFIDEFDAAKKAMKNREIEESVSCRLYDEFGQINKISAKLYFPVEPIRFLFSDGEGKGGEKNNRGVRKRMKDLFLSPENSRYCGNFLYEGEDNPSIFFRGVGPLLSSQLKDSESHLTVVKIGDDNDIKISAEEKDEDRLEGYISGGAGLIAFFVNGASLMSKNIIYAQKKARGYSDPLEFVVTSILDQMGISDPSSVAFFKEKILDDCFSNNPKVANDPLSPYYYDKGFSLTYLANEEDNIWKTTINTLQMSMTPERFLYLLCSRAHVVGLSATCTINSPVSNFDLSYLKEKLKDKYVEQTEEEKKAFKEILLKQDNQYGVDVSFINSKEPLGELLQNKELVDSFKSHISNKIGNYEDKKFKDFQTRRIGKALVSMAKFLLNDKSQALLVMRNENATKEEERPWNEKFIRGILDDMGIDLDGYHGHEYELIILSGKDFDSEKRKISQARQAGKKVIIVSSYSTVGIGQNLQYEVAEEEDSSVLKKQDIDSIYLEKPTHIIANIDELCKGMNGDNLKNALLAITQIEEIAIRGTISSKERRSYLEQIFGKMTGIPPIAKCNTKKLYDSSEVNDASIAVLVQAVGRLCRTRNNDRDKTIYVDEEIRKIDFSHLSYLPLDDFAPVFRALYSNCLREPTAEDPYVEEAILNAIIKNERLEDNVNHFLANCNKNGFGPSEMQFWKELREGILKRPYLLNEEDYKKSEMPLHCYVQAPKGKKIVGYNEQKDKGGEKKIFSFTYENEGDPLPIPGMGYLLKNPRIAAHFKDDGIPTYIPSSFAIMGPYAKQAIYSGALGENLTKFILEQFGITLKDIDDPKKFEKFDFVLANDPDIYFDAKYWQKNSMMGFFDGTSRKLAIEEIRGKLKQIGGKKALIINALPVELGKIPYVQHGKDVLAINCLYDMKSNDLSFNVEAIKKIKEFIND